MFTIDGVCLEAISACVPKNTIQNLPIAERLFGEKASKIVKSLGIPERRVCKNKNTSSLDLCMVAAEELFKDNTIDKNDIGAIIFVTMSPEYLMPNNATLVQEKLSLSKNIPAYDINLACSGYPFGLWNASMIAKTTGKKVLLLDGEKQSHITSDTDRSTSLIFSDAGTATIVSPSNNTQKWIFNFRTDGSKHEAIVIKDGGSKNWLDENSLIKREVVEGSLLAPTHIQMDGMGVLAFVSATVPESIKELLNSNDISVDDVDNLLLHQANKFSIKQISKSLKIDLEKTPIVIHKYGNTSSASIPLNICDTFKGEFENKNILMSGFGAGLSVGNAYINTQNCRCLGVIEYDF